MSSDFGEIMDALATAAEGAVGGLTVERALQWAGEIEDENFPYLYIYDPAETSELGEFQLTVQKTTMRMLLFTKDETQEALAVKMDTIRDAIAADRTLGGVVQMAYVSERTILEPGDTAVDTKAGYMVIETVEQTGHIISATIKVDVQTAPAYVDWSALDNTIEIMVDTQLPGEAARLAGSNLRTDLDTIAVGSWRYQIVCALGEHVPRDSQNNAFNVSIAVKLYYHIAPATSEETIISSTLMGAVDGLLNRDNWQNLVAIDHVLEDGGPTLALDDIERVD